MVLPTVPLGAVIEGDGPGAFLTEHPDRTYARNRVANVPWIVIRTHNEMEMFFKSKRISAAQGSAKSHVIYKT
jgi:hypothetical protein